MKGYLKNAGQDNLCRAVYGALVCLALLGEPSPLKRVYMENFQPS